MITSFKISNFNLLKIINILILTIYYVLVHSFNNNKYKTILIIQLFLLLLLLKIRNLCKYSQYQLINLKRNCKILINLILTIMKIYKKIIYYLVVVLQSIKRKSLLIKIEHIYGLYYIFLYIKKKKINNFSYDFKK